MDVSRGCVARGDVIPLIAEKKIAILTFSRSFRVNRVCNARVYPLTDLGLLSTFPHFSWHLTCAHQSSHKLLFSNPNSFLALMQKYKM